MSVPDQSSDEQPQPIAIGISFGNGNSSIAYTNVAEGKAEVIANEEGDRQIPSVLSYIGGEEYTGTQAKSQIVRNPRNTIAYFRDFLGKAYSDIDPSPCHASAHPVTLESGKSVGFIVQEGAADECSDADSREKSSLTVSEVTTRHLRRLRQSATDYLGKDVTSAVIAIPSDFSDSQKDALRTAAETAGLSVLQFIPEPISALLGHDAKTQQAAEGPTIQEDKIVLVADLGATRSDIAVVASRGGMYTTLATTHDCELGGSTLDKVLIEHAAKEFLKKHKSAKDPRENERSLAKLLLEAENVKKALSLGGSASFSVESLSDGIDFSLTVNRTRFELLANKPLMAFTRLMESAVQKADLDVLDVDVVLLSGGTAHIPKIASNLRARFPDSTVIISPSTSSSAVNPSELASRGAAIQASLISEFEKSDIEASTEAVVTVTPHLSQAIGLVTTAANGKDSFSTIIEAETPVPVRRTAQIGVRNGGDVLIRLAEGIRAIDVRREEKSSTNGKPEESDDEEDVSDDEPEEIRSKILQPGKILAEMGLQGVKKDSKVEVQVNVGADSGVTVVCREVGGKGGVRGTLGASKPTQNGSAS